MNQQQVATQGDTEVVRWTEAERKFFDRKNKAYQEAAAQVNEAVELLREQYDIDPKDGWQLGNGCFVRPKQHAAPAEDGPIAEPIAALPVSANGHEAVQGAW
jgi:hypothetical protein